MSAHAYFQERSNYTGRHNQVFYVCMYLYGTKDKKMCSTRLRMKRSEHHHNR